jgi:hypothetical protein
VALISTEYWLLGLDIKDTILYSGLLTVNKSVAKVHGNLTTSILMSFPEEHPEDPEPPLINLALRECPFTERTDMYFDVGSTDPDKDLDVVTAEVMIPVYLDTGYVVGEFDAIGTLPPKAILMRCLAGSGLLYVNCYAVFSDETKKVAPWQLHADKGLFYYSFPRNKVHKAVSASKMVPLGLTSLHLRTFEPANRFQLVVFK